MRWSRLAVVASGEQIQAALRAFVAKWEPYAGSEKAEAQTFLKAFAHAGGNVTS